MATRELSGYPGGGQQGAARGAQLPSWSSRFSVPIDPSDLRIPSVAALVAEEKTWADVQEEDVADLQENMRAEAEAAGSAVATRVLASVTGNNKCSVCGMSSLLASQVYIEDDDPGFNWQGGLRKLCFQCCQGLTQASQHEHRLQYYDRADQSQLAATARREDETTWYWSDGTPLQPGRRQPMFVPNAGLGRSQASARIMEADTTELLSEAARKMFVKALRSKWRDRSIATGKSFSRARGQAYKRQLADLVSEHQVGNRAARRALIDVSNKMALKIAIGFLKIDHEGKRILRETMLNTTRQRAEEAEDPQLIQPSVPSLRIFAEDNARDYVEKIVDGLDENFICRETDCRHLGPNRMWLIRRSRYRHRCPRCVVEHWPWRMKKNRKSVPAQKALILSDLVESVPRHVGSASSSAEHGSPGLVVSQARSAGERRHAEMVLCEWPDSTTEQLCGAFKEVQLNMRARSVGDFDFTALRSDFVQQVHRASPKEFFYEDFEFQGMAFIEYVNQQGGNIHDPWIVPECVHPGPPYGAVYEYEPGVTNVMKYTDVMRMWGLAIMCVEIVDPAVAAL